MIEAPTTATPVGDDDRRSRSPAEVKDVLVDQACAGALSAALESNPIEWWIESANASMSDSAS